MSEGTKKCPYCGAEIPTVAKKCKYCGEWLVVQEKDKPKSNFHLGAWIEGIIAIILVICMIKFDYNDGIVLAIILLYIGLHIYFLPALIADKKRTNKTLPILILNLFFGWTGIGWIGCLIWAIMLPNLSKNVSNSESSDNMTSYNENSENSYSNNLKEFAGTIDSQWKHIKRHKIAYLSLTITFILLLVVAGFMSASDEVRKKAKSIGVSTNCYEAYNAIVQAGGYKIDNISACNAKELIKIKEYHRSLEYSEEVDLEQRGDVIDTSSEYEYSNDEYNSLQTSNSTVKSNQTYVQTEQPVYHEVNNTPKQQVKYQEINVTQQKQPVVNQEKNQDVEDFMN